MVFGFYFMFFDFCQKMGFSSGKMAKIREVIHSLWKSLLLLFG
jgi:hypothetical protein